MTKYSRWYSGSMNVFRWVPHQPAQPSGSGGEFFISAHLRSGDQTEKTRFAIVPLSLSQRQGFLDPDRTKELLAATFTQIGFLRSYRYFDKMVQKFAEDVMYNYHFTPEFLRREEEKLLIWVDLDIERTDYDVDGSQFTCPMDEQDILCPLLSEIESSRGYGGSQMDVRFDEIRPATELKGFEEANVDQLQLCSICLGELSEGEVILAETSCSHVFHRRCLYGWLRRAHFCPNCQASFAI